MVAQATAKYIRVSERKVRKYGREVKNKPYKEARATLSLSTSRGARELHKVIQSAVSNLMSQNENVDEDGIKVAEVKVDQGPTMKRWRPRARGRADRIKKRTCHISVVVSGEEIAK